MAQIPCKSCGGLNDIPPDGALTGECQYCGALVTFPKLSGSEAERLFNKAEEFRKVFHFDRAIDLYKELIKSDPDEPEYYWGLALSSYGIEYVEEKGTGRRVPTCHRLHYAPLTSDPDYLEALKRSDPARRGIYEAEGKRIAEIQSRILAVAGENKYDVFICFKQTDDDGT